MGRGIKIMVGNMEIMVSTLNNSSALNLTLGHIIPGAARKPRAAGRPLNRAEPVQQKAH